MNWLSRALLLTLTLAIVPAAQALSPSEKGDLTNARSLLAKNQNAQAIKVLNACAKKHPNNAEVHLLLGEANLKVKQYSLSKQELLTAMRLAGKSAGGKTIASQANTSMLKLPKSTLQLNKVNVISLYPHIFGASYERGMDQDQSQTTVSLEPKPKVLDFYADWCKPCQQLKPIVERFKKRYADKIEFVALNADEEENQKLMDQYGVSALPTLVFLAPDGEMVTATIGFSGEDNVTWGVKELLKTTKEKQHRAQKQAPAVASHADHI